MSPARTVVIVGAGFSGTLVAVNLLRSQHWTTTRVVLIERSKAFARGKAYADREQPYLLNVPAARMSADPLSPLDFLTFARHLMPTAGPEDFLPRALYGEYLEATLLDAEVCAPAHVRLDRLRAEVCAVEPLHGASEYRVQLADGRTLLAQDVVLALGNPPPGELRGTNGPVEAPITNRPVESSGPNGDCPGYVTDPWAAPLKFRAGEHVLLVGTGLTMADVACAADASTNGGIVLHALSRHGLIPPSQTAFAHAGFKGDSGAMLRAASFSALTLFRCVRQLTDETERRGGDWREAITFIRGIAPALWQRLPMRERRRMLRHLRPYWDVHRHRLPAETLSKLRELQRAQRLHVQAGRLMRFQPQGGRIHVTWRPRGASQTQSMIVDRVINCTGPDYNVRRTRDPLLRSLLSQGLATGDALGLGLRTGQHGALLDARGRAASNLFYVGPMLRADYWEATAAQELRGHAERLAAHLATPVGAMRAAL